MYQIRKQIADEEKVTSKYVRIRSLIALILKRMLTNQGDINEQINRRNE